MWVMQGCFYFLLGYAWLMVLINDGMYERWKKSVMNVEKNFFSVLTKIFLKYLCHNLSKNTTFIADNV